MESIDVNPADLRRFASFLDGIRDTYSSQRLTLMGEFAELKDHHTRDGQFAAFETKFFRALEPTEQFLRHCESYAEYLCNVALAVERVQEEEY